ncbi:sodium:proton antiporter [Endozoicomonas sp. SCSIO W0465]|uniref:cation:proton antiporter n=1 Tax=Endozoicomonas sp. SCSIO W0465 TaxID=2918516 RepID=UPI00207608C3|nr:sodium:proton antiporter [Endozoicomonas sp. SCSIO W0465]USE35627.1 sodium:proton antiporter [Endozoicomonas sp. SCSIO W0465]
MLIFCGLFLLAAASAILLKKLRFPYTIGLVVIGMALGIVAEYCEILAPIRRLFLTHDLIMYVLLPVLVFEAAINIKLSALMKELVPVLMLAILGVVLSTLVVGAILGELTPLTLAGALLFGALISATDPVAVIALFKEVKAPERMSLLMDAESLLNDATAIVMFGIVLSIIQSGTGLSGSTFFSACIEFFRVFFGGIFIGTAMGGGMLLLLRLSRGMPYVHIALTTILAFSSFIIADHVFETSGVMSVIAAGIITRSYGRRAMADFMTLRHLDPYWEFMAFVANSFIFLLLGLSEDFLLRNLEQLSSFYPTLIIAILAVLLARFLVVYLLLPLSNLIPLSGKVDGNSMKVMFWGGLRGVVPVALMLSIPDSMPEKRIIIEMTLAVILFSLLIQGTTIGWLMSRLGIKREV